jgi:hypothetical protein
MRRQTKTGACDGKYSSILKGLLNVSNEDRGIGKSRHREIGDRSIGNSGHLEILVIGKSAARLKNADP